MKDINPNAHVRVFKKAIRNNGEIVEVDWFHFTKEHFEMG
jgi:hypothetical protein